MKPLNSRGGWPCWLHVVSLFLAVLGGLDPRCATAQNYPKEYIVVQPVVAGPVREGDSTTIDLEYAFGQDALDLEPVSWYRNGVLFDVTTPVLQTYATPFGVFPKLWDPYTGLLYPEGADPSTATKGARNACARWVATLTTSEPGMYRAKIGAVGNSNRWTYTNFAQVAMVPRDPSRALEIVRNPESKSVSAPNSDPLPGIKLFGDMRSHVSPLLNTPFGAATDAEGFTYIADTLNHCIRRISPGGRVTTVAGIDGHPSSYIELSKKDLASPKRLATTRKERDPTPGYIDGVTNQSIKQADGGYRFEPSDSIIFQSEPKFTGPEALTVSDIGVVYVADTGNNAIRRIRRDDSVSPPAQRVDTLFGGLDLPDLKSPRGIFFSGSSTDPINNPPVLYVLNSADYSVKKLYLDEKDGSLKTTEGDPDPYFPTRKTGCENIAGLGMTPGWQGVPVSASEAKFYSPRGIIYTTDKATGYETIYVADTVNHVIRQISRRPKKSEDEPAGPWIARTVVGFVGSKGNVNGVGTAARLNYPVGLAVDEVRGLLYFTEFGNHSLRRVNLPGNSRVLPSWTVELVAGSGFYGPAVFGPNGPQGTESGDGLGAEAVFYYPAGISFNKTDGSIMLSDTNNHCIRKVAVSATGANAWIGRSAAFAGTVGVFGNRDFQQLEEFQYNWKRDAVLMTDRAGSVGTSSISGTDTDTLSIANLQYEDAGVYALVVTNTFDKKVELSQALVYIATLGDWPKFQSPAYQIASQENPGVPLVEFKQGMDLFITAAILPSDQVTYQWEVTAEYLPDENGDNILRDGNGDYIWIALSDLPLNSQTQNNPVLKRLLGENTVSNSGVTISGSTTSRLAIEKLQAPLTDGVPPQLRFRVQSFTRAVPALPVDTKVDTLSLSATWSISQEQTVTVVHPAQTLTVGTSTGLVVGMTLSGTGITQGTKIQAIDGLVLTLDTPAEENGNTIPLTATVGATQVKVNGTWTAAAPSEGMYLVGIDDGVDDGIDHPRIIAVKTIDSNTKVLTLDRPALRAGTDAQISAAVDVASGVDVSVRHKVFLNNANLSVTTTKQALKPLTNLERVAVESGDFFTLDLSAGTVAASGNPNPTYQWFRKDSIAGTPVKIDEATGVSYTRNAVQIADRGYYFVRMSNTVDGEVASVDSNAAFLDVARAQVLTILDMNLDGGLVTSSVGQIQERVVDKTKSKALSLIASVDASVQPTYRWTFKRDIDDVELSDMAALGAVAQIDQRTYGQLSFTDLSDEASGVFTLKATIGSGPSASEASCSWHVTVRHLPKIDLIQKKVFQVGIQGGTLQQVTGDTYTVDLSQANSLYLRAAFKSPPSLPLSYRWRRDGVVFGGTSDSLTIDRLTIRDMGVYSLEVTNALGTLVFGQTRAGETAFPGTPTPAGWTLVVSGKPSVTAQPVGKVLVSTNTNISPALAGTIGAAIKAPALQAAAAPAVSVQRVGRGQRLALQVAVAANPAPTYQWYRARPGETSFSAITGATSAIYVLPVATDPAETRTRYYVEAKNSLASVKSDEITVQVEWMPYPVVSPNGWAGGTAPVPSGTDITLDANVYYSPDQTRPATDLREFTYQWKVNGNPILGAVEDQLKLSKIEPTQAGAYSVVVTNVAGSNESTRYQVAVNAANGGSKYFVFFEGADELTKLAVSPNVLPNGVAVGTRVTFSGVAPPAKMLQHWELTHQNTAGQTVKVILPARAGQFVMPAADVTVTPIVCRSFAGNYTGFLTLEAPWDTAESMEWGTEESLFRPSVSLAAPTNVRGFFSCTVSTLGAVSGQIQLENKIYSFTTVLDAEMRGTFRIATTLKGMAWSMNGRLAFNPTEANRQLGYLDNVLHVVLTDALLATPPLVQVGQTLYSSAAGYSGATEALRLDVTEGVLNSSFAAASAPPEAAAPTASSSGSPSSGNGTQAALPEGAAAAAALPLTIVQNPINRLNFIGGTVVFTVLVRGTPPFTYEWTRIREGSFSEQVVREVRSNASSDSLSLSNIQTADLGSYRVVVRDASGGVVTSTRAFLTAPDGSGGTTGTAAILPPMYFTAAAYRNANGQTKETSFGQGAVLSVQVRFGTGISIVQGYLGNGSKFTASASLGRAFTSTPVEAPAEVGIYPGALPAAPYTPTSSSLSDQALEALSETLLRRFGSPSIPLWLRGDSAMEPLFGTMIFNGPRVYGSLGVLNLDSSKKACVYTPNALAGYFFDPTVPHLANLPVNQLVTNQFSVTMTTPDVYIAGLLVSWPTPVLTPTVDKVFATVDGITGLLFGGMLETTTRYVQSSPPYSPDFAGYKNVLACTTGGVLIQKPDILPGFTWTPSPLGGYVGFLYRGKNAPLEPLKNVLGSGTSAAAVLKEKRTERIEPFLIDVTEQY
jgi:hypothetical protein